MKDIKDNLIKTLQRLKKALRLENIIKFVKLLLTSFFGIRYFVLGFNNLYQFFKKKTVYRLYWGRGNLYKQVVHFSIVFITVIIFFSGVVSRLFALNTSSIALNYSPITGNIDLLQQGNGIQTVLQTNPEIKFNVNEYIVKSGDTLQSIANQYKVSKDTIKWANLSKFNNYDSYNSEKVNPNDKLSIPEINGVLYNVKPGDTIDSVISKTSGDKNLVIQVNQLEEPNFSLDGISKLLIPNGNLAAPSAPPPTIPVFAYRPPPSQQLNVSAGAGTLNGITFSNPLSDPSCGGYGWSRGFSAYHNGIDLPKSGGCPIRAACDGNIIFAGWSNYGEGFNVRVNCGNGIQTSYYHSDGNIGVKVGQQVQRGQFIMYMGCSGNCTGTHLHFGLKLNNQFIDPCIANVPGVCF